MMTNCKPRSQQTKDQEWLCAGLHGTVSDKIKKQQLTVASLLLTITCMQAFRQQHHAVRTVAANLILDIVLDRVWQEVLQLEEDLQGIQLIVYMWCNQIAQIRLHSPAHGPV